MRNYLKTLIWLTITFLILAGCEDKDASEDYTWSSAETTPSSSYTKVTTDENTRSSRETPWSCDVQTASALGRAYFLANPLSDTTNLEVYIRQNKVYFMQGSDTIILAKALGTRLVAYAFSTFSQEDYNKGYESALGMGATMEIARDVAGSLNSDSLDANMMGSELLWLAEVLPYAANGDWGPFQTTGTMMRNQIRPILPFMRMMLEMDPAMRQLLDSTMKQFGPIAEDQIVMLAIMYGLCK